MFRLCVFLCCAFLFLGKAHAVEFEVYQSSYKPLNLALLIGSQDIYADQAELLVQTITQDLDASRSFKSLDPLSYLMGAKEALLQLDYADWRIIGSDILVLAELKKEQQGWLLNIQLHNPFTQKEVDRQTILLKEEVISRNFAHRVADYIYHQQTGLPSYFTSQIVFIKAESNASSLVLMDHDGKNIETVASKSKLLLSPDMSPDRTIVAYNTFINDKPRLQFFNLQNHVSITFANFKGLNSTPEFSPDGQYVAATLSHTGNSEIHIYDIKKKKWKQFTHNKAIDTTPTWSPDGKWIAFTSNRNGSPQIYRKSVSSGEVKRVSLEASYNTSPVWAPIGDRIAFVTKKSWEYAIATVHIDGTGLRYLATGDRIESPTWSPNGQIILYSAEEFGVKHIYSVPIWGGEAKRMTPDHIDASDPSWLR